MDLWGRDEQNLTDLEVGGGWNRKRRPGWVSSNRGSMSFNGVEKGHRSDGEVIERRSGPVQSLRWPEVRVTAGLG